MDACPPSKALSKRRKVDLQRKKGGINHCKHCPGRCGTRGAFMISMLWRKVSFHTINKPGGWCRCSCFGFGTRRLVPLQSEVCAGCCCKMCFGTWVPGCWCCCTVHSASLEAGCTARSWMSMLQLLMEGGCLDSLMLVPLRGALRGSGPICGCWCRVPLRDVYGSVPPQAPLQGPSQIKGPDNSTSQLLEIMSKKCCSGDGEGRKDKGGGGGKMVCDKVVCV